MTPSFDAFSKTGSRRPVGATILSLVLLCLMPVVLQGQNAGESRSTLDGVYTRAQATSGQDTWTVECALCHTTREFTGRLFELRWTNRTVHDLFEAIRTTMPFDRPGGLSDEQYAALVSYLLQLNEYPAGDEPLGTTREELSPILIQAPGADR
jgi:mono/diheme cytochrome c family protein